VTDDPYADAVRDTRALIEKRLRQR